VTTSNPPAIGRAAVAELLVRALDWRPVGEDPVCGISMPGGGSLRRVARRHGRQALHYEPGVGEAFPDAALRAEVRRAADRVTRGPVIVFTDFLHSREVWQWEERVGGVGVLREVGLRAGADRRELAALLRRLVSGRAPRVGPPIEPEISEAQRAVVGAILRRAGRIAPSLLDGSGWEYSGSGRSEERITGAIRWASPSELRALWRSLRGLTVLDLRCGSGARLAAVFGLLVPLYDATLERMNAHLRDVEQPSARRRGGFEDFRRSLATVPPPGAGRAALIAGWILTDNLFGADPSRRSVALCRARLRRLLGEGGSAGARALVGLNVRAGLVGAPGGRDPSSWTGRTRELHTQLHRSVRLLRRLSSSGEPAGWSRTVARISARLRALERGYEAAVDGPVGGRADGTESGTTRAARRDLLDLRTAFPGRSRVARFDVILPADESTRLGARVRNTRSGMPQVRTRRTRELPMTYPQNGDTGGQLERANDVQNDGGARSSYHAVERESAVYPERVLRSLGSAAPEWLHVLGETRNLRPPLLGLFCSGTIPPDLVLPALEIVRGMTFAGAPAVGGFHTAVEKEWLRQLLEGGSRVVLCRARGLGQRRLPALWREAMRGGGLSLASGFGVQVRRPTLQSSAERNDLVGALATAAFVAHATPGGMTHELTRRLVDRAIPVFTLEHPANHDLLRLGAEVVRRGEELVSAAVL
jgi:hypothetical protein